MSGPIPPCGAVDCGKPATLVDTVGCGWCSEHGDGTEDQPAMSYDDFDPWWAAATCSPVAFAGMEYGEWPEGWSS